jgi:DNA-binding transcriptional MerR regulator
MYTISKVSEKTGVSAYTLRYYEKIGLLPSPIRKSGGTRFYTDADIQFMNFLNSLKKTGMSLEDITEFVKDGCILNKVNLGEDINPSIQKRIEILTKHLLKMEIQRQELDKIITLTKDKLSIYDSLLSQEREAGDLN